MNNYLVRVEYAYEHEILNRIKREFGAEIISNSMSNGSVKYFNAITEIGIKYPEINHVFSPRTLEISLKSGETYILKLKEAHEMRYPAAGWDHGKSNQLK